MSGPTPPAEPGHDGGSCRAGGEIRRKLWWRGEPRCPVCLVCLMGGRGVGVVELVVA